MQVQQITDIIEKVLEPVESIDYAFLFGSATGRLLPDSDIDVLVGGEVTFDERLSLAAELSIRLKRDVDLVPVREARSEVIVRAMSRGFLVFAKNREALKKDYFTNWRAFENGSNARRMRIERIKRQYG